MRKHFALGFLAVIVVAVGIYISNVVSDFKEQDAMGKALTIFEDIDELGFLAPYEVVKTIPVLPEGAVNGYFAKISYKGNEYSVTAFIFASEDAAWKYMWNSDDFSEDVPHYATLMDSANDIGRVTAADGCNYYKVEGNCSDEFVEFVNFMSSNMKVPVKQGELR